jgi:hypothetical protein
MTVAMNINLDGDGALAHLNPDQVEEASELDVLLLDKGMSSGRPSVTLHIAMPDGERHVVVQTSARLFCAAARAILARHPDLFEGD